MRYRVKTWMFRNFNWGDIIVPFNNELQFAKSDAMAGDPCFSLEFIEKNDYLFEKV
jgi:hypothetical protein